MALLRLPSFSALQAPLVLVLGVGITLILSAWIYIQELDIKQREFEQDAVDRISSVQNGMNDAIQALEAINLAFQTFAPVSREQFHFLTQPLLARYPYIQAFSYHMILKAAQRPAYEAEMQRRYPGFTLTEERDGRMVVAGSRESYRVVHYMEPMAGNEAAFGLDAASRRYQDEALERAVTSGLASATGLVRLAQETGTQRGFVVLKPVYRDPREPHTARGAVPGFTGAVFRAGDLVEKTLLASSYLRAAGLDISVYSGVAPDEAELVFRRGNPPPEGRQTLFRRRQMPDSGPLVMSRTFLVAGAPWHMVVSTQPGPIASSHHDSLLLLLCGMLGSCLAAFYLRILGARSRRIKLLVDELNLKNDYLIEDISGRKRAELALRQSQEDLRKLAAHQEAIREDERKRIAREVHDELGGLLTGIKAYVTVSAHRSSTAGAPPDKLLSDAAALIDTAIETVRRIIADLRPSVLDQLGVWAALEWYVDQIEDRTGLTCRCDIDDALNGISIDSERSTMLFRIVQEALTNVVRHAGATRAAVRAEYQDGCVIIDIEDNGKGIEAERLLERDAWGILGMHERSHHFGGQVRVSGKAGEGTVVSLRLPLETEAAGA